jgi:gas vesicle protein
MKDTGERVLWFVIGASIGAGATFLFGTKEGRRYRRQMARMAEETCEQITETGQEILDKGRKVYESGREFVEETGKRVGARLHVAAK